MDVVQWACTKVGSFSIDEHIVLLVNMRTFTSAVSSLFGFNCVSLKLHVGWYRCIKVCLVGSVLLKGYCSVHPFQFF